MEFVLHSGGKIKLVLKEDGKPDAEIILNKPKMGAVMDFEKKADEAQANGGVGGVALVAELLVSCGMPESVLRDLDADQMDVVMSALMPNKKK